MNSAWKMTAVVFGLLLLLHSFVFAQSDCSCITQAALKGDVNPADSPAFSLVPNHLTMKSGIYLRTETLDALEAMADAAREDGIDIQVISAMRTWSHQRRIWNGKWNSTRFMGFTGARRATEILRYSSMPGTSRHHWGTDVDLNALKNSYFESGTGKFVYAWLRDNAASFGFVQVYGDMKNGRTGYQEEKWHWSFWPLANRFLRCYLELIPDEGLSGFEGAEYGDSLDVIDRYVQGIDGPH
mgnify:FL=1